MSDEKPPMPAQPTTKELPAADKQSLQFSELRMLLINGFKVQDEKSQERFEAQDERIEKRFCQLEANVDIRLHRMESHVDDLLVFKGEATQRFKKHSDRSKNPSDIDLDILAKQGLEIAKNVEQDKAIAETRELAGSAVAQLAAIAAAADQRAKVLDDIAVTVGKALKSKLAERIALAGGGFILAVLAYYARKFGAPQ